MRRASRAVASVSSGVSRIGNACLLTGLMLLAGLGMFSVSWGQACSGDCGTADILGPHGNSGRGCIVCHVPHPGSSLVYPPQSEMAAIEEGASSWGVASNPDYGTRISLVDGYRVAELSPTKMGVPDRDVAGVLLCLSCHDGNVTPYNMMRGASYEDQMGLLAQAPSLNRKIPTLLVDDGLIAGDHPIGPEAQIPWGNGLEWSNGRFRVVPGSPYAQFVSNYGWPALAPRQRANVYGVSNAGEPYALCITCHDQHVRSVFASGVNNPIAADGGGKVYTTYFFVNGPYNPRPEKMTNPNASSAAQFCRQCHFANSNEGNNSNTVPTFF